MNGTNFFTGSAGNNNPAFVDASGNGFLCVGTSPFTLNTSGYSIGCLMVDNVAGKLYINTGTATAATWTVVGSQS